MSHNSPHKDSLHVVVIYLNIHQDVLYVNRQFVKMWLPLIQQKAEAESDKVHFRRWTTALNAKESVFGHFVLGLQ